MFHVIAELKNGDREGRGHTLKDAVKTVGPLQPRSTVRVIIAWRPSYDIYPLDVVRAEGGTMLEAMEVFIDKMTEIL